MENENRVLSSKVNENDYQRAHVLCHRLYEKGVIPRCTMSSLVKKALDQLAKEELDGGAKKEESTEKDIKIRTLEKRIQCLEREKQDLTNEKRQLYARIRMFQQEKQFNNNIVECLKVILPAVCPNINPGNEIQRLTKEIKDNRAVWDTVEFVHVFNYITQVPAEQIDRCLFAKYFLDAWEKMKKRLIDYYYSMGKT